MLRSIWVRRLPSSLQPILVTQQKQPLNDTAELADNIYAAMPSRTSTAMASTTSTSSYDNHLPLLIQQLSIQVSDLKKELSMVKQEVAEVNCRSRSQSQSTSRSRSRSRSRGPRQPGVCWYHWTFKEAAKKCTKPCSWDQGNEMGSR